MEPLHAISFVSSRCAIGGVLLPAGWYSFVRLPIIRLIVHVPRPAASSLTARNLSRWHECRVLSNHKFQWFELAPASGARHSNSAFSPCEQMFTLSQELVKRKFMKYQVKCDRRMEMWSKSRDYNRKRQNCTNQPEVTPRDRSSHIQSILLHPSISFGDTRNIVSFPPNVLRTIYQSMPPGGWTLLWHLRDDSDFASIEYQSSQVLRRLSRRACE